MPSHFAAMWDIQFRVWLCFVPVTGGCIDWKKKENKIKYTSVVLILVVVVVVVVAAVAVVVVACGRKLRICKSNSSSCGSKRPLSFKFLFVSDHYKSQLT